MKIFLTGATGYVGSAVAQKLVPSGHKVLGLARSAEAETKLRQYGIEPHRGDLSDLPSIEQGVRKADAVINAAGSQPRVELGQGVIATAYDLNDFSWKNDFSKMVETERNTVSAILNALEGSGKPFIFTSGSFVVGDLSSGDTNEVVYDEEMPFVPPSFMAGRVEIEKLVQAATYSSIRSVVLRPGMVFGHKGGWQFSTFSNEQEDGKPSLTSARERTSGPRYMLMTLQTSTFLLWNRVLLAHYSMLPAQR